MIKVVQRGGQRIDAGAKLRSQQHLHTAQQRSGGDVDRLQHRLQFAQQRGLRRSRGGAIRRSCGRLPPALRVGHDLLDQLLDGVHQRLPVSHYR